MVVFGLLPGGIFWENKRVVLYGLFGFRFVGFYCAFGGRSAGLVIPWTLFFSSV